MTNKEVYEKIGELVDKSDDYLCASLLPKDYKTHYKCLAAGMKEIRQELRKLYFNMTGEDPWKDNI